MTIWTTTAAWSPSGPLPKGWDTWEPAPNDNGWGTADSMNIEDWQEPPNGGQNSFADPRDNLPPGLAKVSGSEYSLDDDKDSYDSDSDQSPDISRDGSTSAMESECPYDSDPSSSSSESSDNSEDSSNLDSDHSSSPDNRKCYNCQWAESESTDSAESY